MTSKCDAYQIYTTGKQASDARYHNTNLNLELGLKLTLFYTTLTYIYLSGKQIQVYKEV